MISMEWKSRAAGPLQTTAAEWLVRIQNDELSLEEITDWQQWLSASDEHRQAFERMQHLWQGFESLPNKTAPALPASAAGWRPGRRIFAIAAGLAIVVATLGMLAVGYLVWRLLRRIDPPGDDKGKGPSR